MAKPLFHSLFLLSLVLFLTAAATFSTSAAAQLDDDKQTLLRIKAHWKDPPSLSSWTNASATPCSWNGISCSGGAVTDLILIDQGIDGEVPPFTCDLKNLTTLNLFNNSIGGGFPGDALSRCSNLVHLELSQNYLNGSLPADLDTILSPRLKHLGLAANNFGGTPPAAVARFPAMRILLLDNNLFVGSLPPEILGFGGHLPSLENLTLAYNNFTPAALPAELNNLKKLRYFWMSNARLIGEIPASTGELLDLDYLDLSNNQLSGRIPDSLWGLPKLRVLYLYKNRLEGGLMTSTGAKFAALSLEEIDMSRNKLNGSIPDSFGKLQNLKFLFLYGNSFSGTIPAGIGSLPNLFDLRLFTNNLTGPIPADIGRNSRLWNIEVWENRLTGELPKDLCAGGSLIAVVVYSNGLSGGFPDSLGNCSSLLDITLSDNDLSGELPPKIWSLKNLMTLSVQNNRLSGMLPDTLPLSFSRIEVSNNLFSGSIPSFASGLLVFKGSNNSFTGGLPRDLKGLAKLQEFVVDGNRISGDIPASIAALTALTNLNLRRNQLTGVIPEEIGSLPVLNYLDLSDNHLSGQIPDKLGHVKLNFLNLSSNALDGQIPQAFQNGAYEGSFLSNPGLCSDPSGVGSLFHLPRCATKSSKEMSKGVFALVLTLGVLIALVGLVFAFLAIRDLRRKKSEWDRANWKLTSFHAVSFSERSIVRGISAEKLVGCGGSGEVYRVEVGGGEVVAVKKIRSAVRKLDRKLEKEFLAEVEILGSIRHMNIVRLLCCVSSDEAKSSKLLVYEYMENGSLYQWLHSKRRLPGAGETGGHLDWAKRLEIAVGAAQGLCYMHHGLGKPIVHRDVKSSNILLDADFKAKVADFGLARILEKGGEPESVTTVAGSFGYMAPECAYSKKVDEKMDVYSFGVVLLELVTGKQAHDGEGDSCLAEWTWRHFQEGNGSDSEILEVVDEQIRDPIYVQEMATVIKLGLICTGSLPSTRPTMKDVLQVLLRSAGAASAVWGYQQADKDGKLESEPAGPLLKKGSRRSRRSKTGDHYGGDNDNDDSSALV